MSELEPGNEYLLACTDQEYFNTIKPNDAYLSKLSRLRDNLPLAKLIVSLGMAGGEDICTLAELYGEQTKLIGVDISPVALELARKATLAMGVEAEFIEGNVTKLNMPDRSIDGFVLSAILHEVYSYADDGKNAFSKTIQEAYSKTAEGGCIYISDFAAPRIEERLRLRPKSNEAKQFIDYFIANFRTFNGVKKNRKGKFDYAERSYGSSYIDENSMLFSESSFVSEVLWHFKHYKKVFGDDYSFNSDLQKKWKEINEVYLPPNPIVSGDCPMPINEYVKTVIQLCKDVEILQGVSLKCVEATMTSQRPNTIDMLDEHFSLILNNGEITSRKLITECTNWMDLIFKKINSCI